MLPDQWQFRLWFERCVRPYACTLRADWLSKVDAAQVGVRGKLYCERKITGSMTQSTMSKLHTHYDNLKVARDAPPEVIRAAYKTLCHKFHPDRHSGSEKATHAFQLINTAYEVLSDPASRSHHDAWIAKQESIQLSSIQSPSRSASGLKAWDGQERRRRSLRGSTSPAADRLWHEFSESVSRPAVTVALWASIGLVGAMLVVLHQL